MNALRSNRRDFLRKTAAGASSVALAPYFLSTQRATAAESKSDRPLVALVGSGGRGCDIAGWARRFGDLVAFCDADLDQAEKARAAFGGKGDIYQDYRKVLERKDIEIILNGTPDHWHTAVNTAACKAGKDVYAEKPITLTIDEGKTLCRVVEETQRIVQVGTMQRSDGAFQRAVEVVRNGRIGRLKQVWVALPYYTTKGGPFPAAQPPKNLNWDLYQGQAPEHDYCKQRTHANFRWWYEYAGGIITDWGNHHVDIAHWGMGCDQTGPVSVEARGLFPNPAGPACYNTPDRFFSRMLYPSGIEVLYFASLNQRARFGDVGDHEETPPEKMAQLFGKDVPDEIKTFNRDGIMFLGEKGRVFVNRGGIYGKAVEELKENPLPADAWRVYPSTDHMANFFECVKTRKQPCATVQTEHRTITACHLTNISLRLNRKLDWDPARQEIVGDAEAQGYLKREQRASYAIEA